MKRNFFLLTIFAFLPLYAFGDYIPGRVRAAAHAELVRSQGDGRYAGVQGASIVAYKTDDKGYTGLEISLDNRAVIPFAITRIQRNRCGNSMIATFSDKGRPSELRIDQNTPAACRNPGISAWRVTLTTSEDGGTASHLVLQGIPAFYRLSK
jgi:hypothetical protein